MIEAPALEPQSWSLAGAGKVGEAMLGMAADPEVAARIGLHQHPDFVLRQDGWHEGGKDGPLVETRKDRAPNSQNLFVAMPSTADNEPTLSLMREFIGRGDMVVTAEKAALADNITELTSLPGMLGYWAAHGGGTKMIDRMRLDTVDPANIREFFTSPNGTYNFMLSRAAEGANHDQVAEEADGHKLIEPGAEGLVPVAQSEMVDVARKELLKLKMTMPGFENLSMAQILIELTKTHIETAFDDPANYGMLTANFPEEERELAEYMTEGRQGGFEFAESGLIVIAGLMRLDRMHPLVGQAGIDPFMPKKPLRLFGMVPGPTAAYYVRHAPQDRRTNDGWSFTVGSGAGADTTANAMLDNSVYLRRQQSLL